MAIVTILIPMPVIMIILTIIKKTIEIPLTSTIINIIIINSNKHT